MNRIILQIRVTIDYALNVCSKIVLHRHLLSRHIESNPIVPYLFYGHGSLIWRGHLVIMMVECNIDPIQHINIHIRKYYV